MANRLSSTREAFCFSCKSTQKSYTLDVLYLLQNPNDKQNKKSDFDFVFPFDDGNNFCKYPILKS